MGVWERTRDELQRIELTKKVKRSNNDYNTFERILWEMAVKELSVRNEKKNFKSKDKAVLNARTEKRRAKEEYEEAIKVGDHIKIKKTREEYINKQKETREVIENQHAIQVETIIQRLIKKNGEDRDLMYKIIRKLENTNKEEFSYVKDDEGKRILDKEKEKEQYAMYYENLYKTRKPESEVNEWVTHVNTVISRYQQREIMREHSMNQPIVIEELQKAIKQLKPGKASGPDMIPNELIINGGPNIHNTLLNVFNEILITEKIPNKWKESEIISIYKGKGDREKMENKRGITLASNLVKLFERIINNRLVKYLEFTEGQAGGRKERSTIDQLFILKTLMRQRKEEGKRLYIVFLDIEKVYDKTWQESVLHIIWNKGIKGKIWRIIRLLNKDLNARCRVRQEKSRNIEIEGSLRQGGVLSVTLFAKMMDTLCEDLQQEGLGVKFEDFIIPSLLLVDDVAVLAENKKEMSKMLMIIEEFRKRNRLSLSKKKTKIMIVNKKEEDNITEWKIGEMKKDITNQYTYLGEIIDSKCRMMPHLEEKKNKMLWMAKRIGIMKEEVFWKTRPETSLDLYEKMIIPAALYGCETWKLSSQAEKVLEDLQVQTLKNIMKLPKSTPTIAVLGETGCIRMKHRIHKRQLNYIYKLENMHWDRWVKEILHNPKTKNFYPNYKGVILQKPAYFMSHRFKHL